MKETNAYPGAKAPLARLLEESARARRWAHMLIGDPAAAQLKQYADELTAEAERVEAKTRHGADQADEGSEEKSSQKVERT